MDPFTKVGDARLFMDIIAHQAVGIAMAKPAPDDDDEQPAPESHDRRKDEEAVDDIGGIET